MLLSLTALYLLENDVVRFLFKFDVFGFLYIVSYNFDAKL